MSNDAHTLAMIQYAQAQKAAAEAFLSAVADIADDEAEEDKPAPRKVAAKKAPAKAALPAKKAPAKLAPPKKGLTKPAPEPEPEEDEEEVTREAELAAMSIAQLRALAIKRGFAEAEVKAEKNKTVLAEAIAADELANPDEAEEDDDEDEDDGEEAQYTRVDLKGKGLRELKALAKEAGHTVEDLRGLDADSVIDLLLGESDDADADADAEDEDAENDGEENYVTEAQLKSYSLAELKKLTKDYGLTVPRGATEAQLIELILADDGEAADEE